MNHEREILKLLAELDVISNLFDYKAVEVRKWIADGEFERTLLYFQEIKEVLEKEYE